MTRGANVSVGWVTSGRGYFTVGRGFTAEPSSPASRGGGAPAGGGPAPAASFSNPQNGPVLSDVDVQPIFWGKGWAAGSEPFADSDFVAAARRMVANPYLLGLDEYGCNGTVTVRDGIRWDDDGAITTTVAARNGAVGGRLLSEIDDGHLPEPDEAPAGRVYAVVLTSKAPQSVPDPFGKNDVGWNMYSLWSDYDWLDYDTDQAVHWLWLSVYAANNGKYTPLQYATKVFSHELVEKMTDPGPNDGWRDPVPADNASQIGDPVTCNQAAAVVDGVAVQAYWSQKSGGPVLPHRTRNIFPYVPRPSEARTPGPTQHETVQADCGIPTPLELDYTVDSVTQTWTIDVGPVGFDDPVATLTLFGKQLSGAGAVNGAVSVTAPDGTTADVAVSLSYAVNGMTLTLSNTSFDGAFTIDVAVSVTEKQLDTYPVPVSATASVSIPFATLVKTYDQLSKDRLEACGEQRARLHAGGLREGFHKPTNGDPPLDIEYLERAFEDLVEARAALRKLRREFAQVTMLARVER